MDWEDKMRTINDTVRIRHTEVKNRMVMPPMVCFNWGDTLGFETVDRAYHYGLRAKGDTGLIVIEATSISPSGRITESELGLWDDAHINQFKKIADACHAHGSKVIVQLVHAGSKSIQPFHGSSSENFSLEDIQNDFISASLRAEKAGLDGVEIHGAHGYLLNQLTSLETNMRTDQYGGTLDNRLKLSVDIVKMLRDLTNDDFIIGYRYGVNDPSFKEDIIMAKALENAGVDFMNVSAGIGFKTLEAPISFPFSPITYMGVFLQEHLSIPCACVFGIRAAEQADWLIKNTSIAMIAVGKGLLSDPDWTHKAIYNEKIDPCLDCAGGCKFRYDGRECPWALRHNRF